jgi:MoxR-like ATPase
MSTVNPAEELRILSEEIKLELLGIEKLKKEMSKAIIGQEKMIDGLLIALLTNSHVLLEGSPGLAKTLAIRSLSKCLDLKFSRIQFTPDLLPADVTGTLIYSQKTEDFIVKKGPIFASIVLADEINRAPAKVQSALLEAMQENHVTIGESTLNLPKPFLVLATQNPIEQEGTYPLPEAQLDRFSLKINIEYPTKQEEKLIIQNQLNGSNFDEITPVMSAKDIENLKSLVSKVYLDEKIEQYIVDIVFATRNDTSNSRYLNYGASPRGSIYLAKASKARAFLHGRAFVIPEDVREMAISVLQHRVGLSFEAEADQMSSAQIIENIVSTIDVP